MRGGFRASHRNAHKGIWVLGEYESSRTEHADPSGQKESQPAILPGERRGALSQGSAAPGTDPRRSLTWS